MNIYSKNNPPIGFYVYAYLRDDGSPYYIGKGKESRAWAAHRRNTTYGIGLPKESNRIIIVECRLTDLGALALERRLIRWYGRKDLGTGILRNRTDGGEGTSGVIVSSDTRKKLRESQLGRKRGPQTIEHRIKNSLSNLGKSRGHAGMPLATEHKNKIRISNLGKTRSTEQRIAQSLRQKGRTAPNKGIKTGPHEIVKCSKCDKIGGIGNMKRYHFDNCRTTAY